MAAVLALALVYLYFALFVPPFIPKNTGNSDDRMFLGEGLRIVNGERIYRDFFEFYFPGTQLFYAFLFRIFGVRAWIPNVCLIGIGMALVWSGVVISRKLIDGAGAVLPSLMFLWVAFISYLAAAPHWYSMVFVMIATAVIAEARTPLRLMVAGALIAVATLFAQHHGVFAAAGVAAFILWEGRVDSIGWKGIAVRESWFLAVFGFSLALGLAYFVFGSGLGPFFSSTILFPMKYSRLIPENSWSENILSEMLILFAARPFHQLRVGILALTVPAIYLLAIAVCLRDFAQSRSKQLRCAMLLSAVGLATFLSIANSASFWRIATVSLPAFIVLVWFLNEQIGARAMLLLWIATLTFMVKDLCFPPANWTTIVDTPSGRIAMIPNDRVGLYQWLAANTHPGDYLFDASDWDVYFWFLLRNPTKLQQFFPAGYIGPEQLTVAIHDLEDHRPEFIIWSEWLDTPSPRSTIDYLAPARAYLHSHYRKLKTFVTLDGGENEVWERAEYGSSRELPSAR